MEGPCIILDAGACEWRCGWADDDGPAEVLPGRSTTFVSAFEALEAFGSDDGVEAADVLVTAWPDAPIEERHQTAHALFAEPSVRSVCVYPAPLLAMYNTGFETGILVDVGQRAAFIYPIVEGHAVLDAATMHPRASRGGDCHENESLDCDMLFQPPYEGAACSLHEALLRTVDLVDVSLRAALLGHIALVGGGTKLVDFPERLERLLNEQLVSKRAPWRACVRANADRRLASWIGGTIFCAMPSGQSCFLTREEYQRDPAAVLSSRWPSLACRTIESQEAHHAHAKLEVAGAVDVERRASKLQASQETHSARVWWMKQAPMGGSIERMRMRLLQQEVVHAFHEHALAPLPGATIAVEAALTAAMQALRSLLGCEEKHLRQRMRQARAAEWAVCAANTPCLELSALDAHHTHWMRTRGWRRWRTWRGVRRADQLAQRQRQTIAIALWGRKAALAVLGCWAWYRKDRSRLGALHAEASIWRKRRQLAEGYGSWSCRAQGMAAAERLLCTVEWRLAGWRALGALRRHVLLCRRVSLGRAVAVCQAFRSQRGSGFAKWAASARGKALRSCEFSRASRMWAHNAMQGGLAAWATETLRLRDSRLQGHIAMVHCASHTQQRCWSHWCEVARESGRARRLAVMTTRWRMVHTWRRLAWRRLRLQLGAIKRRRQYHNDSVRWMASLRLRLESVRMDVYRRGLQDVFHYWSACAKHSAAIAAAAVWLQPRAWGARLRRAMSYMRIWYHEEIGYLAAKHCAQLQLLPRRRQRQLGAANACWLAHTRWRQRSRLLPRSRRRQLVEALIYWRAEATWRIQRHRWLRRQVQYMDELQHVMDGMGERHGQRWMRRLLSIGFDPQDGRYASELGAGMLFHPRCATTLEKALQRSSPCKSPDPAMQQARMRVLDYGVDSYLADVLE